MSEPLKPDKQETWYCLSCGSRDIRHDAIVQWDAEREVWDVLTVLDDSWCEDCMSKNTAGTGEPHFGEPHFGAPPDKNAGGSNGT